MADNRAEQIMDAFTTLVTGLTTTGSNVERDRAYAFDDSINYALAVYQGDDTPFDRTDQNWFNINHDLEVSIVIHARLASSTPISQTLNLIRKEITAAVLADYTLGLSFVIDTVEGNSLKPVIDIGGEKPIAIQTFNWLVKYERSRTDPSA